MTTDSDTLTGLPLIPEGAPGSATGGTLGGLTVTGVGAPAEAGSGAGAEARVPVQPGAPEADPAGAPAPGAGAEAGEGADGAAEFDDLTAGGPDGNGPTGLGVGQIRGDALAKALGTFPYASDLWAEGLLWGAVLRAPVAHARIRSIDTSPAMAVPGVYAVLTAADLPAPAGGRPALADGVVRHHGEAVAAVAADHPEAARLAAQAIVVDYEQLEPVTDPEKSFQAPPIHPDGNLFRHIPLRYGDPDSAGEIVVEGLYQIGRQDPAPIGAESGLAVPRPDGGVELHLASTDPHGDRDRTAAALGLEAERVRLVVTGVPGAAGDREDFAFQTVLGLLATRTGRPVKMTLTREESFLSHGHRHPALLRYRHHADGEGRLVKVEAQILLDGGAYAESASEALAAAAALAVGPYQVDNVVVDAWAVRTNNPPAGRLRAEGELQACFAHESQLDKLAARLDLDPLEVRRRNIMRTGDPLPTGQAVTCPAPVSDLLDAIAAEPLPPLPVDEPDTAWLLPGGPDGAGEPSAIRRGIGYAVGMSHMLGAEGADEVSTASVRVSGTQASVICAAVDTGAGFSTLARQIVQDVLGVTDVYVAPVDTDQPPAGPSARSRQTWVSGGAVERAAKMVRHQLLQPLAAQFGMSPELLTISDGKITSYDGVLGVPIEEALEGKELWATAQCRPHPTEPLDGTTGQGDAFVSIAFCAMRAVVDVDIELGTVRVVDVTVAQDVGRALNPAQIRARIEAGVTQGLGLALMEELAVEDGLVLDPTLGAYRLPTALDAPEIRVAALVEERDVVAPFGAKAVGAVPAATAPAAVAAAVRAATGRPIPRLPVRLDDAVALAD